MGLYLAASQVKGAPFKFVYSDNQPVTFWEFASGIGNSPQITYFASQGRGGLNLISIQEVLQVNGFEIYTKQNESTLELFSKSEINIANTKPQLGEQEFIEEYKNAHNQRNSESYISYKNLRDTFDQSKQKIFDAALNDINNRKRFINQITEAIYEIF